MSNATTTARAANPDPIAHPHRRRPRELVARGCNGERSKNGHAADAHDTHLFVFLLLRNTHVTGTRALISIPPHWSRRCAKRSRMPP